MRVGIPKEIKNNERRVAVTPAGMQSLVTAGHQVLVEKEAGLGSGFADASYAEAGAIVAASAADVWERAELIVKVKEPQPSEFGYFREGLIVFAYLHLAAEPALAAALTGSGVTAIAYETVEVNRTLPLLTPMSEIAGRMAAQIGAQFLEKPYGGKGILLSGVPGVRRGKVAVIGGGVVGTNAARIAAGLGAEVTVIDLSAERLRYLDDVFGSQIHTLMSSPANIAEAVAEADLVIGAVLIPGAKAPKLVTEGMVASMGSGSVVIDVAIDQGGIFDTVDKITTHDNPTYVKHDVVHYAVANIPGAVPRTSTLALTNVTMPYVQQIANKGAVRAIAESAALKGGVNTMGGHVACAAVAASLGTPVRSVDECIGANPDA